MELRALSIVIIIFLFCLHSCKKEDENEPSAPVINSFDPGIGTSGTAVTILGYGFSSTSSELEVKFNGVAATITSSNPTVIKTMVPEGATTGPITVTIRGTTATSNEPFTVQPPLADDPSFYFGADLSYVNQILDHGGVYRDQNEVRDPYRIFADHGTDLVRLRLWHNPVWTKEIYEPDGPQLYNDLFDVERAIAASKAQGMQVMLDFHYSDFWADPGRQEIPAAWLEIKDINVLRDSVYNYTFKVMSYLDDRGLMPEFVQIGNETNCGMMYEHDEEPVEGFPPLNVCDQQWGNFKTIINSAIKAVRDVSESSSIKSKILLHVADPVNVTWWFDNVTSGTGASDFDIIGFSYYPIWHRGVSVDQLSDRIAEFKTAYNKDVMILETAYPWTTEGNDSNGNIFGSQTPTSGYPFTPEGQLNMLKKITQEVVDGGGIGVVYWEPGWITSGLRDFWSSGSSWENAALFDYDGNVGLGMSFMTASYDR